MDFYAYFLDLLDYLLHKYQMIFITKAWHSRGQRFDPAYLHQIESKALEENPEIARFQDFFSLFILKLFGVSGAVFSPRLG